MLYVAVFLKYLTIVNMSMSMRIEKRGLEAHMSIQTMLPT